MLDLPAHGRANRSHQKIWRVLFQENSRGAGLHQPARLENAEDRSKLIPLSGAAAVMAIKLSEIGAPSAPCPPRAQTAS